MQTEKKAEIPATMKFVLGGTSGMCASVCVQPLDLVKNRMQMSGIGSATSGQRNSLQVLLSVIKNEGFFAIYSGLSAGLLRQATYSTARLGIYTNLFEQYTKRKKESPNFFTKISIAVTAGICGAFIGTPAEICLIRMTSDGRLPPAERLNYSNVFNALIRIAREEGVLTLWRGAVPTMGRAAVVNGAQLATYSQAKQKLLEVGHFTDGLNVHIMASLLSGFTTSVFSLPIDIAKTRIQNMKTIDGKPEYKNMGDVILRVVRNEGILSLWKGFTPYFLRIGPHTVLTFIFLEQLNRLYIKHIIGDTSGQRSGGL
ncbi:unnamed protein product [Schistosoma bovis]|uniref:Mitochondrial 2-oxoglutarate/malate carrier protein n=2 Tax=Schistosoma TaxID=6181 RepID=A0A095C158_SCHHA|nr:hypothetical protein MS3_00002028 [Schistosoma haematobium]CAH8433034.1 unnamed protein product [Schistosoma mattheei]CAH8433246.1 unnamed protein product [Schistosoma bovis]KAH9593834.1 hypothetical protein MS3_00002028 [Schistosoma haematobium]CAH8433484.1 unnamed protein product [Schistosoma haematobium]CAH8433491.1 unnamed protein product [Schistosoma haematobium]